MMGNSSNLLHCLNRRNSKNCLTLGWYGAGWVQKSWRYWSYLDTAVLFPAIFCNKNTGVISLAEINVFYSPSLPIIGSCPRMSFTWACFCLSVQWWSPYEQKTQQSPDLGRICVLQLGHVWNTSQKSWGISSSSTNPQWGQVRFVLVVISIA